MAITMQFSVSLIVISLMCIFLFPLLSHASDPDPLQDFCIGDTTSPLSINGFPCKPVTNVTSNDFFFDGLTKEGNTNNMFGSMVTPADVVAFPGLNTLGISMNRVDIAPGGENPPHSHPRATETGVVIEGRILVGLISSSPSDVFYSKILGPGEMFVIPRGLVHFQMNVGEEKALIFTAFNSQRPGAVAISVNLFGSKPPVPNKVLTKAFQVEERVIDEIKSKLGAA